MYSIIIVLSMSVVATLGRPQYVEPEEIPGDLDDAYQFAYAVASPEHGDYHGHQQSRDENGFTSGSYYLLGADGQWSQTIFADKGAGYQALYNQRPAGAPPPQVSEVSYQVFVHPGATAISAQGGVPTQPEAPAPLAPFGGIQQKSLVGSQPQNIQVNQRRRPNNAQVRQQPSSRFNRETQVSDSSIPQQVQQSVRFNRDAQYSEVNGRQAIPDLQTSPSESSNVVVVEPPRTARAQAIPDMKISASTKSDVARAVRALPPGTKYSVVPVYRKPKSIFTEDISTLLRRFQPRPVIPN